MNVRDLFKTYRVLTVSNLLSLSRIALTPVIGWCMINMKDHEELRFWVLGVAGLMVLTDFFDGYLARKLGQETPLGQYLDPVADKISVLTILILLTIYRDFPLWLTIFIFLREILGTWGGAYLLIKKNILGKPNYWGKWGVTFIALSAVLYVLNVPYKEWSLIPLIFTFIGGIAAYAKTYWRTLFPKN